MSIYDNIINNYILEAKENRPVQKFRFRFAEGRLASLFNTFFSRLGRV